MRLIRPVLIVAAAAALVAAGGCSKSNDAQGRNRGPIQVGYVVIQQSSTPLVQDLPGRVTAYQTSDVRPQVNGVIQRRLFREGSIVRQGQTLYQIDPSIYQAQAAQAAANLQSARANAEAARTLVARLRPLVETQAVAKQDYTNAVAQAGSRRCRNCAECRRAAQRADQSALDPSACPDHRADRPVGFHRRRAGYVRTNQCADDHHSARSGLCRHPAIGGRSACAAPGARPRRGDPDGGTGASRPARWQRTTASPEPSSSARWWSTRPPAR